jgi:CBS domain-containing protein
MLSNHEYTPAGAHAMQIRDIMTADPVSVESDTTIEEVATLMKEEDIGAVPVVEDGEITGIVTDRDIVLRCIAEGKDATECTAEEIMSSGVRTISSDTSTDEAARIMGDQQIRRLAVVENGRLIGMVSIGDLAVKADNDDLSGDTLEDVSKGVKQSSDRKREASGAVSKGGRGTSTRAQSSQGSRSRKTDEQAAADAQPFEAETEDLKRSQTGADRSGRQAGNQRRGKQEKQAPGSRQPQGLKSDSSSRKQGIANHSAKEENERNDRVIPFRKENEVRNTRVQKPKSGRKTGS